MYISKLVRVAMNYLNRGLPQQYTTPFRILREESDTLNFASIIIPTRDRIDLLRPCVESIERNSASFPHEVIIVDNGSQYDETLRYLEELKEKGLRLIRSDEAFNFSKLINLGSSLAKGDFFIFLNNDTFINDPRWIQKLRDPLLDDNVGVVGPVLKFADGTVQHAGIAWGFNGLAGHPFRFQAASELLKKSRGESLMEVSGITFACAAATKRTFDVLSGLDPRFPVGLNDVDFCFRAAKIGKRNLINLKLEITHFESQSRNHPLKSIRGIIQAIRDISIFLWAHPDFPEVDDFIS